MRRIDITKIESLRLDKGLTKTQFCKANKINIKTYNSLGKGKVHDETILKIAKALDIRPSEILVFEL